VKGPPCNHAHAHAHAIFIQPAKEPPATLSGSRRECAVLTLTLGRRGVHSACQVFDGQCLPALYRHIIPRGRISVQTYQKALPCERSLGFRIALSQQGCTALSEHCWIHFGCFQSLKKSGMPRRGKQQQDISKFPTHSESFLVGVIKLA
jgi:hypothetical protein